MTFDLSQIVPIVANIIIIAAYISLVIYGAIDLAKSDDTHAKDVISYLLSRLVLYPLVILLILVGIGTLIGIVITVTAHTVAYLS